MAWWARIGRAPLAHRWTRSQMADGLPVTTAVSDCGRVVNLLSVQTEAMVGTPVCCVCLKIHKRRDAAANRRAII